MKGGPAVEADCGSPVIVVPLLSWPGGVGVPTIRWPAALRCSGSDPGQPDISCLKAPAVKNASRPILSQLNNGPAAMKLDQPRWQGAPRLNSGAAPARPRKVAHP